MRNEELYEKYAILGFPCQFVHIHCVEMYNRKVEKICDKLPKNAKKIRISDDIHLRVYVWGLRAIDAFIK